MGYVRSAFSYLIKFHGAKANRVNLTLGYLIFLLDKAEFQHVLFSANFEMEIPCMACLAVDRSACQVAHRPNPTHPFLISIEL